MEMPIALIYKACLICTSISLFCCGGGALEAISSTSIPTPSQNTQGWSPPITDWETVQMLEDLESGALEERCTPKDLSDINQYLLCLAEEGLFLEKCEEDLLYGDSSGFCSTCTLENSEIDEERIEVQLSSGLEYDLLVSQEKRSQSRSSKVKEKIAKAWEKAKQFVKKHRKFFHVRELECETQFPSQWAPTENACQIQANRLSNRAPT